MKQKKTKTELAIEEAAIKVLVSILNEITERYNMDGSELMDFFKEKGTLKYMGDIPLLFGLMHDDDDDEDDRAVRIFMGDWFEE